MSIHTCVQPLVALPARALALVEGAVVVAVERVDQRDVPYSCFFFWKTRLQLGRVPSQAHLDARA